MGRGPVSFLWHERHTTIKLLSRSSVRSEFLWCISLFSLRRYFPQFSQLPRDLTNSRAYKLRRIRFLGFIRFCSVTKSLTDLLTSANDHPGISALLSAFWSDFIAFSNACWSVSSARSNSDFLRFISNHLHSLFYMYTIKTVRRIEAGWKMNHEE